MTKWRWLWAAWILVFLAIEIPAIFNSESGDTLSENVWAITAVPFFWWLFAGFLVWLVFHLLGPRARRWINSWRRK